MKKGKINLRIPGPTPLPAEVRKSLSQQMINHRSHDYEKIQERIVENLKYFFQTENEIYLLTSSGMGGLEAAIANFFSMGDKVIFFTCGEFGNRWADVARAFNLDVVQVKFSPSLAVDKNEVYHVLQMQDNIKGVFFTLNETATGVLNAISEFAPIVTSHNSKPLLLVDAISGLGAIDLPMDKIGIDVLITASQKAWMAPPGLSMIAVSPKAWQRHAVSKLPKYYFHLTLFKEFAQKNQTPATPAVSTIFGLDASLQLMKKEGREKIFKRHLDLMKYTREKIRKINLELFVQDRDASPTVTSIKIPAGIDGHAWLAKMRDKYNVVLAGGMGETKGKIIRIAHMGYVNKKDIDQAVKAIQQSLGELK